jgi:hypothetical protein
MNHIYMKSQGLDQVILHQKHSSQGFDETRSPGKKTIILQSNNLDRRYQLTTMEQEFHALVHNETWNLVPPTHGVSGIDSKCDI